MRRFVLPLAFALSAFASPALATPGFPTAIKSDLTLSYTPSCDLCHQGTQSNGTAVKPFALAMKDRGLKPADNTSLTAALQQMETDKVDSDGDGVTDIEEIVNKTDPNSNGAATASPVYGCARSTNESAATPAASVAPARAVWPGAIAIAAIAAILRRRRRGIGQS